MTPLQLATYVSRVATGRAVQPHLTRSLARRAAAGRAGRRLAGAGRCRSKFCTTVREGMWAVVNEPGGTAPLARLPLTRRCSWPARPDRRRCAACPASCARAGISKSEKLPWEFRPHALFVAFAPYDAPRYAVSVVVEHGNAGRRRGGAAWRATS